MTASVASLTNVLKRLYPQGTLPRIVYENNPLLGIMPKYEDFGGEDLRLSLLHAPTAGRSATFARSQANKTGAKYTGFILTRSTDYSLASITGEAIEASKGNAKSLVTAIKSEFDAAIHIIKRSIAISMYRNGGGSIGRIASGSGTDTITLSNINDITNFEVGMVVVSDDTDGTGGGADDGERLTVSAVDRDLGTVTQATTATWDSAGNFAANDYIFVDGDFGLKMKGLDSWLPATAPTAGDSHFGVDRSEDATRLGGVRYVADAAVDGTYERTLVNASARVGREGGSSDYGMTNNSDRAKLVNELGTKVNYEKVPARMADGAMGNIGFSAIVIEGDTGPIKIVSDHNCPQGTAYLLQLNTWKLYSLGPAPRFLDFDGNRMLREASADAYEARIGMYGQIGCVAPGWNARINITAVV